MCTVDRRVHGVHLRISVWHCVFPEFAVFSTQTGFGCTLFQCVTGFGSHCSLKETVSSFKMSHMGPFNCSWIKSYLNYMVVARFAHTKLASFPRFHGSSRMKNNFLCWPDQLVLVVFCKGHDPSFNFCQVGPSNSTRAQSYGLGTMHA